MCRSTWLVSVVVSCKPTLSTLTSSYSERDSGVRWWPFPTGSVWSLSDRSSSIAPPSMLELRGERRIVAEDQPPSRREREVVRTNLIAEGPSNAELAQRLTPPLMGTAANHIAHIMRKLGLWLYERRSPCVAVERGLHHSDDALGDGLTQGLVKASTGEHARRTPNRNSPFG